MSAQRVDIVVKDPTDRHLTRRQRYGSIVAWVFDSFWTNWIPSPRSGSRAIFDYVFVGERKDLNISGARR